MLNVRKMANYKIFNAKIHRKSIKIKMRKKNSKMTFYFILTTQNAAKDQNRNQIARMIILSKYE